MDFEKYFQKWFNFNKPYAPNTIYAETWAPGAPCSPHHRNSQGYN